MLAPCCMTLLTHHTEQQVLLTVAIPGLPAPGTQARSAAPRNHLMVMLAHYHAIASCFWGLRFAALQMQGWGGRTMQHIDPLGEDLGGAPITHLPCQSAPVMPHPLVTSLLVSPLPVCVCVFLIWSRFRK